ncbi:hypothetical protein FHS27_006417 [Rhodopirellula rubra]|uniref:Uncharacterized protein n=1 Tax=Aporhodopirellula rubra TaxID=980271 RepID=A0A7W5E5K8_9BACT|nr:hypothetical protein [Aporhodopirellula rubra]
MHADARPNSRLASGERMRDDIVVWGVVNEVGCSWHLPKDLLTLATAA